MNNRTTSLFLDLVTRGPKDTNDRFIGFLYVGTSVVGTCQYCVVTGDTNVCRAPARPSLRRRCESIHCGAKARRQTEYSSFFRNSIFSDSMITGCVIVDSADASQA
jgi:hypothetical protein